MGSSGRVQDVIVEYTHLQDAARTPTQATRVSLQIFHASRAIDSLLAHIAQYECIRAGRIPPTHWTLGSALMDIQNYRVNGSRFNPITKTEIDDITKSLLANRAAGLAQTEDAGSG